MTAEVQEPGIEQLFALERMEEQLDPILCEFVEVTSRCGHTASWHARVLCHPEYGGSPFLCEGHKARAEAFFERHRMRCATCRRPSGVVWTKL